MPKSEPADLPTYLRARMDELGIDSIRQLAARTGLVYETARRLIQGTGRPDEATLAKLAVNLPAPLGTLRELAGRPRGEHRPFVLPAEADQLDERQRQLVLAMIRALLDASTGGRADPAQTVRQWPRLAGRARSDEADGTA